MNVTSELGSETTPDSPRRPMPSAGQGQNGVSAEVRKIDVSELNAWFGSNHVLHDVSMAAEPRAVTAVIGPSGCGKSTFIRCLNRMHEEIQGARASGKVVFDGLNIYDPGVDPVDVRRRIGMVFQRPN